MTGQFSQFLVLGLKNGVAFWQRKQDNDYLSQKGLFAGHSDDVPDSSLFYIGVVGLSSHLPVLGL